MRTLCLRLGLYICSLNVVAAGPSTRAALLGAAVAALSPALTLLLMVFEAGLLSEWKNNKRYGALRRPPHSVLLPPSGLRPLASSCPVTHPPPTLVLALLRAPSRSLAHSLTRSSFVHACTLAAPSLLPSSLPFSFHPLPAHLLPRTLTLTGVARWGAAHCAEYRKWRQRTSYLWLCPTPLYRSLPRWVRRCLFFELKVLERNL